MDTQSRSQLTFALTDTARFTVQVEFIERNNTTLSKSRVTSRNISSESLSHLLRDIARQRQWRKLIWIAATALSYLALRFVIFGRAIAPKNKWKTLLYSRRDHGIRIKDYVPNMLYICVFVFFFFFSNVNHVTLSAFRVDYAITFVSLR